MLGNLTRQLRRLPRVLLLCLGQLAAPDLLGMLTIGQSLLESLPRDGALLLVLRLPEEPRQLAWPARLEVLPHREGHHLADYARIEAHDIDTAFQRVERNVCLHVKRRAQQHPQLLSTRFHLRRTRGSLSCPRFVGTLLLALALSGLRPLRPLDCLVVFPLRLSD
ncbi:MAG: hypothetical protein JO281_22015 [Pseudonocardiales bacterium]|nr:hypothetical protein [Pseudonocardiales bacterium]